MTSCNMLLSGLIGFLLLPFMVHAKVDYISLHEIESANRQPLAVKLNIVEKERESQLKFTLVNQGSETELDYQRINKYMLRLKSSLYTVGEASIYVHEFEQGIWEHTHSIGISNTLILNNKDKKLLVNVIKSEVTCQLNRKPKETLWSIASRYKSQWNVDVFTAMILIYKSNLDKFFNQNIGQLVESGHLVCPSEELIAKGGNKAEMKAEFNRLIKR